MSQFDNNSFAAPEIEGSRTVKRCQSAEITKDNIVRTAARLFVKQGFSQTTMAEIARAVGMSKGNLYNYVRSKDDFTSLILSQINQRIKIFMDAVASFPPETTHTEKLCEAIRNYTRLVDESQEEFIFIHHAVIRLDHKDRKNLFDSSVRVRHFFKELLLMGLAHGEFRVHDPELLSVNITSILGNWALDRWYWSRTIPLEDYIREQTNLVLAQVGAPAIN